MAMTKAAEARREASAGSSSLQSQHHRFISYTYTPDTFRHASHDSTCRAISIVLVQRLHVDPGLHFLLEGIPLL